MGRWRKVLYFFHTKNFTLFFWVMFILTHYYKLTDYDMTLENRDIDVIEYWLNSILRCGVRIYLSNVNEDEVEDTAAKKFCFKRKFLLTYFRQIKSLDPSLISFIFPKKIDSNGWTIDKQVCKRYRNFFHRKSIWNQHNQ